VIGTQPRDRSVERPCMPVKIAPFITSTWPLADPFVTALWLGALAVASNPDAELLDEHLTELVNRGLGRCPARARA